MGSCGLRGLRRRRESRSSGHGNTLVCRGSKAGPCLGNCGISGRGGCSRLRADNIARVGGDALDHCHHRIGRRKDWLLLRFLLQRPVLVKLLVLLQDLYDTSHLTDVIVRDGGLGRRLLGIDMLRGLANRLLILRAMPGEDFGLSARVEGRRRH